MLIFETFRNLSFVVLEIHVSFDFDNVLLHKRANLYFELTLKFRDYTEEFLFVFLRIKSQSEELQQLTILTLLFLSKVKQIF